MKNEDPVAKLAIEQFNEKLKQEAVDQGRAMRIAGGGIVPTEVVRKYVLKVIADSVSGGAEPSAELVAQIAAEVRKDYALVADEFLRVLICRQLEAAR
jgi:hypothetical protein